MGASRRPTYSWHGKMRTNTPPAIMASSGHRHESSSTTPNALESGPITTSGRSNNPPKKDTTCHGFLIIYRGSTIPVLPLEHYWIACTG